MQVSFDGFFKLPHLQDSGYRQNAREMNALLPPGTIIKDAERDDMDAEIVHTVNKAGSRCTAVCTSEFNAEEKRCALECPLSIECHPSLAVHGVSTLEASALINVQSGAGQSQ